MIWAAVCGNAPLSAVLKHEVSRSHCPRYKASSEKGPSLLSGVEPRIQCVSVIFGRGVFFYWKKSEGGEPVVSQNEGRHSMYIRSGPGGAKCIRSCADVFRFACRMGTSHRACIIQTEIFLLGTERFANQSLFHWD